MHTHMYVTWLRAHAHLHIRVEAHACICGERNKVHTSTKWTPAYQTAPGQIAGQGDTHMHRHTQSMTSAYQTAPGQIAGQEDTHMHRHTQSTIPAYQIAPGLIAGQGDTHTVNNPCLPDYTRANRRSGRHTHAQTHIVNNPCLPDCTRTMYIISKRQQWGKWKNIICA